ncbi:hypothetical protein BDV23DRAFT_1952 [Aspergillus alliaceus]|uniref:Uncharacterized protein n=2 Tax=Petromyces alliaceus TaxID=209559 RepID=A0A5N7CSN3_PETAA|nr:hypothetical protein BDV23DRAFT_1952 [Aspergillus alliaceus]
MLGSHDQHETPKYLPSDISLTGMHTNRRGNSVSLSPKSTSPLTRNVRIRVREQPLERTVRSIQSVTEPGVTGYTTQVQPDTPEGPSSIPQEPNFWSGAPPINFQQQFLW